MTGTKNGMKIQKIEKNDQIENLGRNKIIPKKAD